MEVVSAFAFAASVEQASALGAEPPHDALAVALVDFGDLPPAAVWVLQSEARAILASPGGDLEWRRRSPKEELDAGEVPVLLLDGAHPIPRRRGAVLGGVEPQAVRRAVWVYVPAVGRAAGLTQPPAGADFGAQRALGLALGRVVAHELVHVLAPEMGHTTAGLMAPVYDRNALTGRRPRIDPAAAAAYRAGLRRWLAPEPQSGPIVFQSFTGKDTEPDRHGSWGCLSGPSPSPTRAGPGP
jgi:hypothetical protein